MRQMIADARQAFARDVDDVLHEIQVMRTALDRAIGEVSPDQALHALRQMVLQKFDERLPMRPAADPVLRQLLREAYEVIGDIKAHRTSRIDLRDWLKTAEPFVR
jgi:hypothetical protein